MKETMYFPEIQKYGQMGLHGRRRLEPVFDNIEDINVTIFRERKEKEYHNGR